MPFPENYVEDNIARLSKAFNLDPKLVSGIAFLAAAIYLWHTLLNPNRPNPPIPSDVIIGHAKTTES